MGAGGMDVRRTVADPAPRRRLAVGAAPAPAFGIARAASSLGEVAARLARRLHVTRPVRLLESSIVEVPTVVGWLKPVILLPTSALAGLVPRNSKRSSRTSSRTSAVTTTS